MEALDVNRMQRVLVTGASGCIGRHALGRLVELGWNVHAISSRDVREPDGDVVWHRANLLDRSQIEPIAAAARASHLLHLAWHAAPGRWAQAPENFSWVQASLDLLDAFRRHGGIRVVTAGTCQEYDWSYGYCSETRTPLNPNTAYGACKHALERLTSTFAGIHGLGSAWGRVFFVYGPYEQPGRLVPAVIRALLNGEAARCSHGNQIRDYLYAQDVADAFVELLEGQVTGPVNIGSGRPVAIKDIVTRLGVLMGREDLIRLGAIPPAATDVPFVVADTSRLNEQLTWAPRVDLDRGLQCTVEWWERMTQQAARS
jgi:nucleoside-diphosphate-sugar epimerase